MPAKTKDKLKEIKYYLGHELMDFSDTAEEKTRQVLKLSKNAPDPSSLRFEKSGQTQTGKDLYEIKEVPQKEYQENWISWHQEGLRGRFSEKVASLIHNTGYSLAYSEPGFKDLKMYRKIDKILFQKELAATKFLTWRSFHYAKEGETTYIDGYISLPSGRQQTLDVSSIGSFSETAKESLSLGSVFSLGKENYQRLVLPGTALTPLTLKAGLYLWYIDQFHFKQGHWAPQTKKLPVFEIDELWEIDEITRDQRLSAIEAEQEVLASLNSKDNEVIEYYQLGALKKELKESIDLHRHLLPQYS